MKATEGETEANTCSAVKVRLVGVGADVVVVARTLVVATTSGPVHANPENINHSRQKAAERMGPIVGRADRVYDSGIRSGEGMKVKIAIADTDRVVEIEADNPEEIRAMFEAAFQNGTAILWFEDVKRRLVGIARDKVAFIEIDTPSVGRSVGFAASST
jgi:hypothetical protein